MVKDKAGLAVENGASRSCTRTRSEGLDGIRCREGDDEVEGQVGLEGIITGSRQRRLVKVPAVLHVPACISPYKVGVSASWRGHHLVQRRGTLLDLIKL